MILAFLDIFCTLLAHWRRFFSLSYPHLYNFLCGRALHIKPDISPGRLVRSTLMKSTAPSPCTLVCLSLKLLPCEVGMKSFTCLPRKQQNIYIYIYVADLNLTGFPFKFVCGLSSGHWSANAIPQCPDQRWCNRLGMLPLGRVMVFLV